MGSPRSLFVRTTDHEIIPAERWPFLAQCWGLLATIGRSDSLFYCCTRLKTSRISSERVCARLPSACTVANRHLPGNYACASIAFLIWIISWSVDSILKRTRKIAKSDYKLRHVCLSVRPHETTRLSLDGFS